MWRIKTADDVAWITSTTGLTITAAIPAVFDDYATLVLPGALGVSRDLVDEARRTVRCSRCKHRRRRSRGGWDISIRRSGIVFWDAPKVTLYSGLPATQEART
jgi:hypothetical protein